MSNKKYATIQLIGVVVHQDPSGNYQAQVDEQVHTWRIGKHTKGKFHGIGQVFLTENGQTIAVVATKPLAFNQRHNYTPMARFTSTDAQLATLAPWIKKGPDT